MMKHVTAATAIFSTLMMTAPQQHFDEFTALLRLTLCPDNEKRKECESRLSTLDKDTLINLLFQVLINSNDSQLLEVASCMMRQNLDRLSDCNQINAGLLGNLKNTLPQLCLQQTNGKVRRKYVDIVCSLILISFDKNTFLWPEINSFFYDCLVTSNHTVGQEIGFRIAELAPCILQNFNDDALGNIIKSITSILSSDINSNQEIIIDSARSFCSLVVELSLKRIGKYLNEPFTAILNIIRNSSDSKLLTKILTEIIVLCECRPKVLRNHIHSFIEVCIGLLSSQHTVEEVRSEAFECIVELAENNKKIIKANCKDLFPHIVDICIRHLTLLTDEPKWAYSTKEDGDNEDDDLATIAETSLDRITVAIGGKTMLPVILDRISPYFEGKLWQHRCAAITAIGCIAEGCIKTLKPHLPQVLEVLVKFIKDDHPRVIYCCVNTLGQLCVDYSGFFQSNYHQIVFPAIFYVAENYFELPRLQAHAVCCFINLMTGCPRTILYSYSDRLFQTLYMIFIRSVQQFNNPGFPLVLENVLVTLSDLAETLGTGFSKYYRSIISELISLVRSFSNTPHVKYYISAFECLSAILLAVGKDDCINELESVLSILKSFEFRGLKNNDPSTNYHLEYMEIMGNLARVFGDSFSPILPTFLPILLEMCNAQFDNHVLNSPVDRLDIGINKEIIKKAFTAHTDTLRDKYESCKILKKLCKNIGISIEEHIPQIFEVVLNNFVNCYDDDIQSISCSIFEILLKIYFQKNENSALQLWSKMFEALYNRVVNNDNLYLSDKTFDCIRESLLILSFSGINNELLIKIVQIENIEFLRILNENKEPKYSSIFDTNDEDDEDEEFSIPDESDDSTLLASIHDLQRFLFKLLGTNYFPYFNENFELIIQLSECSFNHELRTWAICILSNVIEFCPNESIQLSGRLFDRIKILLTDSIPSVRQSTFFFVAITAEFGSQQYQHFLSFALPIIVSVIEEKDSRDEDKSLATSNAIAAVGKIMKFCPTLIDPFDSAALAWIKWLPVVDDEVDFIMDYLVELVQTKFDLIAAPNNNHLFKALDSLATMLPYTIDSKDKAVNLLTQLRTHVPESFEYWFSNLNPTLKGVVEANHTFQ